MQKSLRYLPVLLFLLSALAASAQLSGVYTIGGTSPSYANFTAAVNDLLAKGVSGPVIFKARSGVYAEPAITLTAITGASATNTVTFGSESGVNTSVNFNTALTLNVASFITIANMSMSVNGVVINLLGKSNNVTIANNILTGPVATGAGSDVIQAINYTGSNLLICGNVISNGSEGICLYGTDNTPANIITNAVIKNNLIQNFYYWGITANFQRGTLIEGNTITTAPTTGYGSIPLYIQNIEYPITVIKNKISITGPNSGIAGMYIVNNHPDSLSEGSVIANNTISVNYGTGMELINNDYFSFYYNTIYIISSGTCFNLYGGSTGNVLADNIFYNASGGAAISVNPSTALGASDYNDFYSTGAIGSWNGSNTATIAAWRSSSGLDAHSKSFAPAFVSDTNLNLSNFTPVQFGTPIASIPDAINGDTRSTPPAVGAYDNGPPYPADTNTCCPCSINMTVAPVAFSASPTSICPGDSVAFTAQAVTGIISWQWTLTGATPAIANTQDPKVVYNTPGTYPVKLTVISTGGSDSLTKTAYITVNSAPVAGIVTGPATICAGETALLSDTGSAGSIRWQSSVDGISFTTITGDTFTSNTITGLTQTTYYRVEASGSCGTDSSTAFTLTVHALPVPVVAIADSVFCTGDSTRVCTASAFAAYVWSTNDTSACITAKAAGSYSVTVTDANSCSAASAPGTIHLYPLTPVPVLSAPDSVMCSYDSTRISSSGPYTLYRWNTGDTTSYTYATAAGNYEVTVTDPHGCTAESKHLSIHIYPVPSVSIIQQGDTLSSYGQVSYHWLLNNSLLPGDTGAVFVASLSGSYTVAVTDTNGCTTVSNPVIISGLQDLAEQNISIYPNPSIGNWQLTVGNSLVGSTLEVFDEQGRVVMKDEVRRAKDEITAGSLPSGVYYLRISNDKVSVVRKLVKL